MAANAIGVPHREGIPPYIVCTPTICLPKGTIAIPNAPTATSPINHHHNGQIQTGQGGDTTSASQTPCRHNGTEWQPPSQGGGYRFKIHGPPNLTAISKGGNCWGINSP
jgi:hypothetical protein